MASIIGLFIRNLGIAFSPRKLFKSMKPTQISTLTVAVYVAILALFPALGSALYYGHLNFSPSYEFLLAHDYYSLEEYREYQAIGLNTALYSLIIGIGIVLLQREAVHLTLNQKNKDITKDEVSQVILAGITFPYVAGFSLIIGWQGYVILGIASLYGFYLLYTGFLYFAKTGKEQAFIGTAIFFIFGACMGIIIKAAFTLYYL